MVDMKKNKILIIDDDRTFTTLIKGVLAQKGYDVYIAGNGSEGLNQIRNNFPDLIILDVLMPEMTGYDFVQKIQREDPLLKAVPIIAISARESMKDFFNSWELAFFLKKPFPPEELIMKVEYALDSVERRESGAYLKDSGTGQKALVVGYDEYSISNLNDIISGEGFEVFTAKRETEGIVEAIKLLPDVIVAQFHKIRGIINVPKLREELLEKEVTQKIPFIVVCPVEMESECRRNFLTKQMVVYSSTREMAKKLQRLLQKPLKELNDE